MTKNTTASYVSGYRDCRGCREHSVNLALLDVEAKLVSLCIDLNGKHLKICCYETVEDIITILTTYV